MSDDAQEWRWVGEDGVEKTVTEQELIAELSSESLANYTLIWKKGWLEWLPAMQVSELLWALPPGKTDTPVKPREKSTAGTPPAPPLYRYPVIKRRAANLKSEKPRPAFVVPRPEADAKRGPALVTPAPVVPAARQVAIAELRTPEPPSDPQAEAEPTEPRRRPAPEPPTEIWQPLDSRPTEEVEIDSIEASQPRAVEANDRPHARERDDDVTLVADDDHEFVAPDDSDPRALEAFDAPTQTFSSPYSEEDDAATRVIPSRPPPPGPQYVGPHAPPASERPQRNYEELDEDMPRIPPPPAPPADLSLYTRGPREGQPDPSPIRKYAIGGAVALAGLSVLILATRGARETENAAPQASAETPNAPSASGTAPSAQVVRAVAPLHSTRIGKTCTVAAPATRVADWADPAIAPAFASIPGSERVVVGFGQSDTYAIGITIDPRTLDRDQVFREFRREKLVSVVPTAAQGQLHFQVVRDGFPLSNARGVDGTTPFVLGATATGLERVVGKGTTSPVWSFADADQGTVPRIATVPGVGHAVTFRRGGKTGSIASGWLNPSGDRQTALVDIAHADGDFVGTPAIAANGDAILVAFASRATDAPAWSVALATAKHGELPKTATPFTIPPGGPGGDGMSPAVGALSGGRWFVQWTEGSSGNRVARAQVLDKDLHALTDPINLSPEGANAGQGAVWANRDAGTVLFYVQNDKKSHELWGTSIECPP